MNEKSERLGGQRQRCTSVIELLAARWPQAFFVNEGRRRPLKLGIHLDIVREMRGQFTYDELATALGSYVSTPQYLLRCQEGAKRISLHGSLAGEVTASEAAYAKLSLHLKISGVRS